MEIGNEIGQKIRVCLLIISFWILFVVAVLSPGLLSVEAVILKDDGTARSVIRPMGVRLPGLITACSDLRIFKRVKCGWFCGFFLRT